MYNKVNKKVNKKVYNNKGRVQNNVLTFENVCQKWSAKPRQFSSQIRNPRQLIIWEGTKFTSFLRGEIGVFVQN